MKILFDHQIFTNHQYGGISNSFVQLISALAGRVDYEISVQESNNIHLLKSGLVDVIPMKNPPESFITNCNFRGKTRLYCLFAELFPCQTSYGRNKKCSIESLKNSAFDVFHPTFYDPYFLPYIGKKPYVLTIHDMIPERLGIKDPQIEMKQILARNASHIVAVSEKTKEDLLDILRIPDSKVTVIYHGAPNYSYGNKKRMIEKKYILYVGNRNSYKCFGPMVKALIPILNLFSDLYLVCTGKSFSSKEIHFFRDNGIIDRLICINPDDESMLNLYSNAVCFIYPSIYEGFGIPILEAYKCNCPVLLNNKSCFPEIAGDAAVYFNLDNNNSDLTQVMMNFLRLPEKDLYLLLEKQRKRLSIFSWEKSAERLFKVYSSCI